MDTTVGDFYEAVLSEQPSPGDLPLDTDLQDIFNAGRRRKKGVRPAADLLRENHKSLVDKLTYWSGVPRSLIKKLVESIETRVGEMDLRVNIKAGKRVPDGANGLRDGVGHELRDTRKVCSDVNAWQSNAKLICQTNNLYGNQYGQ